MSERLLAQGWRREPAGSPFGDLIDATWSRNEGGLPRFGFVVGAKHLNRSSGLHGGMACAFFDISFARTVAASLGQPRIATIHLGVDFVDVAREGEFVELTAEIVRATRSVVFVRGTLHAAGRTIASATGVWKILGAGPQEA